MSHWPIVTDLTKKRNANRVHSHVGHCKHCSISEIDATGKRTRFICIDDVLSYLGPSLTVVLPSAFQISGSLSAFRPRITDVK